MKNPASPHFLRRNKFRVDSYEEETRINHETEKTKHLGIII